MEKTDLWEEGTRTNNVLVRVAIVLSPSSQCKSLEGFPSGSHCALSYPSMQGRYISSGGGCGPDWRTEAKVRTVWAGVRQSQVELQPGQIVGPSCLPFSHKIERTPFLLLLFVLL